jgi:hypothetical protein
MDSHEYIINRLRLISAKSTPCDDDFVKPLLDHNDPIVKQWAISASNWVKDKDFIYQKILQILKEDNYYDLRVYALRYLVKHKYSISCSLADEFLYHAVTVKQKALIYSSLALNKPTIETLSYLAKCTIKETDNETKKVIEKNSIRIAKTGLINVSIDKNELKKQFPEIYERTTEGRLDREIQEKLLEKQQTQLFEIKTDLIDLSETPEKSMSDIEEENYIIDLVESDRVEYISKRTYIRDLTVARKYRNKLTECEICAINNISLDIHHIIPLSKGGEDSEFNMICVCRNCHSRFHQNQIRKITIDSYELINSKEDIIKINRNMDCIERFQIYSNHFYGHLLLGMKKGK